MLPILFRFEVRDCEEGASHRCKDFNIAFCRVFVMVKGWGGLFCNATISADLCKLSFLCIIMQDLFRCAVLLNVLEKACTGFTSALSGEGKHLDSKDIVGFGSAFLFIMAKSNAMVSFEFTISFSVLGPR